MAQQTVTELQIFEAIQRQHKELLRKNLGTGDIDIDQVREFLKSIAQAGAITGDAEKRSLLHALISYWSETLVGKSKEIPLFELLPFDASLARRETTQRSIGGLLTNSIWLLIIMVGLLSLVVGVLGPIVIKVLSQVVISYLQFIGFLLGIVTLVLIGLVIWQRVSSAELARSTPKLSLQNRHRMLAKVRAFWITDVLEKSLHEKTFIALGLREEPDAIANPWRLAFQQPVQTPRLLRPSTSITQVYDNAGGELLILGEPGSGKTTLLLELARDLLKRAESDDTYPMPVVFNLSSWSKKRQSIADWLIDELNTKYQVPHKLSKSWVDADQMLPLLDGLDEVAPEHRIACVEAINTYRQQHGLVPIVICCRSADYETLSVRLLLQHAIVIEPLTRKQINEYLFRAGKQSAELRITLRNDQMLQELATTPLMLSVLMLAYQEKSAEDLLMEGSLETRRQQIFTTYVERMLQHRGVETHYTPQQTKHWLAWLAQQLRQHNQTEFYIEHIQPDWLVSTRLTRLYQLIVRLIIGLVVGLVVGLVNVLVSGLIVGLLSGLVIGLGSTIESKSNAEIKPTEFVDWSLSRIQWSLIIGLIGATLNGLIDVLLNGYIRVLSDGLINVLVSTLIDSLVSIVISILLLRVGSGWVSRMLDEQKLIRPNLGIWYSIRNGLFVGIANGLSFGLISGIGFGLVFGSFNGLASGLVNGLDFGLFLGLIYGLFSGLRYGGTAFIQHFTLRLLLRYAGDIPLNYPRFLDYAAERILLRKIGGGYIFIHRLLQEYFASLDTSLSSNKRV
jgi:DNA polymerase III delta prime subunit